MAGLVSAGARSGKIAILCLLPVMALLAGCQTISPEQQRAADEKRCVDYGFRKNTDAFATCLQRIDIARSAEREARFEDMNQPMVIYRPVYIRR